MPSPGMTSNPGMMPSQFMGNDGVGYVQSGLPHLSPHPANIPRSPMLNSPSVMKSPMGGLHLNNQIQFGGMGQGGAIQAMDQQPGMIAAGPRSAGPVSGTPTDWNSLSQPSVMVRFFYTYFIFCYIYMFFSVLHFALLNAYSDVVILAISLPDIKKLSVCLSYTVNYAFFSSQFRGDATLVNDLPALLQYCDVHLC